MTVYVGDLLTATAASVTGKPTPSRTWKWLRDGTAISGATSSSYTITDSDLDALLAVEQTETNVGGVARATSSTVGPVATYSPAGLFALAEPGVWYDPSDLATLFQDTAGTTPVTTPGQTVALALDKSKGLTLGPELVTNGDFSNGTTGWQAFNGNTTISDVSGTLRQQVAAGSAAAAIPTAGFSTVIGRTYRLSYEVVEVGAGATNAKAYVGTSSGTSTGGVEGAPRSTPGVVSALFIATATTYFLTIQHIGAVGTFTRFDNISVKELPGFHATQATAASRPTYGIVPSGGRRNLLTYTEQFDNAAWTKFRSTVSANAAVAPDGTMTADKLVGSVSALANRNCCVIQSATFTAGADHTLTFHSALAETPHVVICVDNSGGLQLSVAVNLSTGVATAFNYAGVSAGPTDAITVGPIVNGYRKITLVFRNQGYSNIRISSSVSQPTSTGGFWWNADGDGTSGVYIWGAQLETGSTATNYQRVGSAFDVTEAGVQSLSYLSFDGVDDFLVTPTITPGIDKVQVFAGVRRFADTAGVIAEHSADFNFNVGSWVLATGTNTSTGLGNGFHSNSRGTAAGTGFAAGITPATFVPPVTAVLTATHDISGDLSVARGNGVAGTNATLDQGTGNFLAYPLYIGRRGGTSLPFNGNLFSLIVRFGANLDQVDINRAERWVADKTGVTL